MKKKLLALLLATLLVTPFAIANAQITQQLYYNYSNSQVTELQTNLKTLGYYTSNIDGNYQYSTYLAVKNFQTKYGLNPSGSLDFITLNKLDKVLSGEPDVLSYGMRHERVSELQKYLNTLGYLSVQPTGFYGSLTTTAVSNFQRNNGLAVTGKADSELFSKINSVIDSKYVPYKTYASYTVVAGDTTWGISQKFGVTENDINTANNLSSSSYLKIGQVLRIPHINVPVKPTYEPYGEYQDWFSAAQYLFPIGSKATVVDYFSGKSFRIQRTIGSGHADCEPLTAADTAIMKDIYGGKWAWVDRPVAVVVDGSGRRLAASMAGMPHAGLDAYAGGINIDNRSDNYGYGPNYDYIKGNNMDGHFDIHFLGSLRHKDWQIDPTHQAMVKISANR